MSTLKVTNLQHPSAASANVTLDASGNATFGGNGVFAGALTGVTDLTASGGIYLGGTGSANYFDQVEQGTWTPTVNVGSVTTAHSAYIRVGDLVTVTSDLSNITNTTSTSDVVIGGLPYASNSQGRFVGSCMVRYVVRPSNALQLTPYLSNSSSSFSLYWSFETNSTWDGLQYASAGQAWDVYFTLTYRTS